MNQVTLPKNEIHILIVDDDPIPSTLLDQILTQEGYVTSVVASGLEAIDFINKTPPDLVLLDINMPGIDGFETCRKLKADKNSSNVPIIFVTSNTDDKSIGMGFEVGAEDYIRKPILQAELLARVAHQLQYLERIKLNNLIQLKTVKMFNLEDMVTSVAHEVSSPFGTLKMALSHLQTSISNAQKALDDDILNSNRLETFLDDAFEVVNISNLNIKHANDVLESFKLIAVDQCNNISAKINLKEYVESILLSIKPKLKRKLHKVTINIPEYSLITTRPGALSQIIINLISNSYLHAFGNIKEGEIVISYDKTENEHILTYEDNGCGIETKNLNKIFDKYYTTKARSGGSGLGMSIIQQLIKEELDGRILVDSKLDEGITIKILLPIND